MSDIISLLDEESFNFSAAPEEPTPLIQPQNTLDIQTTTLIPSSTNIVQRDTSENLVAFTPSIEPVSLQVEYTQETQYIESCETTKSVKSYVYELEDNNDYIFTDE